MTNIDFDKEYNLNNSNYEEPITNLGFMNVPFGRDYKSIVSFKDINEQTQAFADIERIKVTRFNYIQKDNAFEIKGNMARYEKFNYVRYQNANYTNFSGVKKWFYAFITRIEYVGKDVTRIYIATDVWQTWQFDLLYFQSYIERGHILKQNDYVGVNTNSEPIGFEKTIVKDLVDISTELRPYYVLHSTSSIGIGQGGSNEPFPFNHNCGGVPCGLCNGSSNLAHLQNAIQNFANLHYDVLFFNIPRDGRENCQYIQVVPIFTCDGNDHLATGSQDRDNLNYSQENAVTIQKSFAFDQTKMANDYEPRNKKLFTSQFQTLRFVTRNGNSFEYRTENFNLNNNITFNLRGSCGGNGDYYVYPSNYNGSDAEKFHRVNYGGTVSLGYDANNSMANVFDQLRVVSSSVGILGTSAVGIGQMKNPTSLGIAGGVVGGVTSATNNLLNNADVFGTNIQSVGSASDITDIGLYTYTAKIISICPRRSECEEIDQFFDMYGYSLQKHANIRSYMFTRSNWNYIKTQNANIQLNGNENDLITIKQIFNSGVTIWHGLDNFGDYSQANT